jgi:uncharacterized protein (TIGR00269 family)
MACDQCDREAVMHAAYSGRHLCGPHFRRTVEERVRQRVREDNLLPDDATPADPETWVIGLSGGKDSVVLTTVLHETFAQDPRVELVALSIHEGIEGYRDESLAACETLVADLDIPHETVSYAEEFGVEMDDVVRDDPLGMAACAYCGVFRRDVLSRYAARLDADKLLTGHNLDDEAETALMNILEGDVDQMATQFDASLGPFPGSDAHGGNPSDQSAGQTRDLGGRFVPRAKPLRDVPEKEVALYAQLRDLPMHHAECPHAEESFRGTVQDLLLQLESDHPGTRHSIMAGYEDLAALAAASRDRADQPAGSCASCGAPTGRDRCRTCELLDALEAA